MKRREFLAAAVSSALLTKFVESGELSRDVKITRAVGFRLRTKRSKIAGKNSRRDVHGDRGSG